MSSTLLNTFTTAAIASVATTAAALLLGKKEAGSAAAPLNATSHIVWGDEAADHDESDWQHTALGALLNTGAMVSWSLVQQLLPRPKGWVGAALSGASVSALAYVTDYYVVPKRLTPGFEKRLSARGLFLIYTALAAALAGGAVLAARAR
jgi:hypothetical protein